MVALHIGLLAGCLFEAIMLHRPFIPALGWPTFAIVLAAQALRWWCITTLDYQWNTRVIVIPGASRITGGPYRFLPHPNYVAVIAEGLCAAVGSHRVDHRTGVLDAQHVAVENTDRSRKRRTGEPDMIDLLVVGGGPAGLATAIYGAKAGLEVVVVERRSGPIDKACGEGLMPHTLRHLERLGVHPLRQTVPGNQLPGRQPARRRAIPTWHRAWRSPNGAAQRTP